MNIDRKHVKTQWLRWGVSGPQIGLVPYGAPATQTAWEVPCMLEIKQSNNLLPNKTYTTSRGIGIRNHVNWDFVFWKSWTYFPASPKQVKTATDSKTRKDIKKAFRDTEKRVLEPPGLIRARRGFEALFYLSQI